LLLAWLGALAIGLSLGMLGSGGSILTVPVLVYLVGQDEKIAIAGSLFVVGGVALVGCLPYLRHRMVEWRSVVWFGVPGMAGTWLGAWLSAWVSGAAQLALFSAVMAAAGIMMLRPPPLTTQQRPPRHALAIAGDGLLVGALTGLVGVGGGFLIVPALVLLGGLPVHRAVATSLVIIAAKSFAGFAKYLDVLDSQGLALDWPVLGIVTALGVAGGLVGTRIARSLPQSVLRRSFALLVLAMAAVIAARTVPRLFGG
jgi:uncharacterized protein